MRMHQLLDVTRLIYLSHLIHNLISEPIFIFKFILALMKLGLVFNRFCRLPRNT